MQIYQEKLLTYQRNGADKISPILTKRRMVSNIKKATLATLLIIISLFSTIFTPITAFAQENSYEKTPLTELSKADNFNVEDFKEDPSDYSIKVIQIAESNEGKLNIFTFQPARNTVDLKASSINISYGFSSNGENLTPKNYSLKLISTEGCFDKYEVVDYSVTNDEYRYYNIVSIYRRLSDKVPTDENVSGGTTTEKAYTVGQQWLAYTVNGVTKYEMNTFDTLEVTTNYTGYLRMNTDIVTNIFQSSTTGKFVHMWFIAFNLEDYIAEHIYNADLSFTTQQYNDKYTNSNYTGRTWIDEEPIPETVYLSDVDSVSVESNLNIPFLKEAYTYKRIMKAEDFIKTFEDQGGEFSEEAKTHLLASQWVFAFKETVYSSSTSVQGVTIYQTDYGVQIADASILRVKFMDINHNTYDLGVVNDKTTADDIVDGYADGILGLTNSMKEIAAIISSLLGLVGLLILANFCPPLFNVLIIFFKAIFNGFIWLLSFVFEILTIPLKLIFNTKRK